MFDNLNDFAKTALNEVIKKVYQDHYEFPVRCFPTAFGCEVWWHWTTSKTKLKMEIWNTMVITKTWYVNERETVKDYVDE